jgi:hypothetical protein
MVMLALASAGMGAVVLACRNASRSRQQLAASDGERMHVAV